MNDYVCSDEFNVRVQINVSLGLFICGWIREIKEIKDTEGGVIKSVRWIRRFNLFMIQFTNKLSQVSRLS